MTSRYLALRQMGSVSFLRRSREGRQGEMQRERERLTFYNSFPNHPATRCWGIDLQAPLLSCLTPNSFASPKPILSESVSQVENGKMFQYNKCLGTGK